MVKNYPSKTKKPLNNSLDNKNPKVHHKKVWKPKVVPRQNLNINVSPVDLNVEAATEPSVEGINASHVEKGLDSSSEPSFLEKEGLGSFSDPTISKQSLTNLFDLSKQLVVYQEADDGWRNVVEDNIEIEEGEVLAEAKKKPVEGVLTSSQPREFQVVSQDGVDPSLVETHPSDNVKEIGENSKHKGNQRKRNEKRLILREWKPEVVKPI